MTCCIPQCASMLLRTRTLLLRAPLQLRAMAWRMLPRQSQMRRSVPQCVHDVPLMLRVRLRAWKQCAIGQLQLQRCAPPV